MADIINSPVDMTGVSVGVDTAGLFTPGAAFAIDVAAQLINASWAQANLKNTAFETKMGAIETWLPNGTPASITAGTATSPAVAESDLPASACCTA